MMARSSGGRINISSTTRKIDVDSRISLRFYSRIAENILKQADIFREEKNIIDLYVMLLRYSSLVTETIPCHRDYRTFPRGSKLYLTKKLEIALSELEELKPAVQAKLQELQSIQSYQIIEQRSSFQNGIMKSLEWPAIKRNGYGYGANKRQQPITSNDADQCQMVVSVAKPVHEHFCKISLSIPRPKEETLSKHSILGPNGLDGPWQPPINYKVRYPSNVDFTPLVTTRDSGLQQSIKEGTVVRDEESSSKPENSCLESLVRPKDDRYPIKEYDSLISFETEYSSPQPQVIRQPSPPPVLADVQDLVPISPADTQTESMLQNVSNDASLCAKDPLQLHISTELMNNFMKLAKSNTDRNLETCGVLAGTLRNRKFYITALIIPKQESTSDSCQTTNEEEIFEVQDKQSLFPLGWIHTHPTQSCFMSSIDVHTHYSYQIMLPESIAIVMAPRDSSKTHGIFRLTSGGMTVIRQCPRRGFHSHDPPVDGTPIYSHCTDVYMNPSLKFDVIDLR